MNAIQMKEFRDSLFQELAAAAESVQRDKSVEDPVHESAASDEGDIATLSHSRTIVSAVADLRAHRLKSIEEALQRIDRGEFGTCTKCGEDIGIKRLAAMPWAKCCLQCQTRLEHSGSSRSTREFDGFDSEDGGPDAIYA